LDRDVSYSLSDGSWEATSGSETEEATTVDNFEAETNAFKLESGSEFGTQYYEKSISNYSDEYDVTRTVNSTGDWTASSGDSETTEYEEYQSDIMVETASYTRAFEHGTMNGKLGWIERELEEFYYTSESTMSSGEWELQSGTGYWEQETSYGNFTNGLISVTNNNDNTTTTFQETWKQLYGNSERIDYEVEDNEWTIDDETENTVDLLEYIYNDDDSATIPNNYTTITVDDQTYNDFEDYFETNNNNGNTITPLSDDIKIIKAIELALDPALTAITKNGNWPITNSAYIITDRYDVDVIINGNVATILLVSIRQSEHQQLFSNDVFVTRKQKQLIGQFKIELNANELPDKNTIAMAKYLISLFKANPQNGIENTILLTNNTTKQQVRTVFKNATGKTHVEDIFIGLKQAEERQEIKDYVDLFFNTYFRQNDSFTELAQIAGADKLYEKLIKVLSDDSLKLQKTTFAHGSSANGKYYDFWNTIKYSIDGSASQSTKISDAKTLVHELFHAYMDLFIGNIDVKQDEAMAYALIEGHFPLSTGIYKKLNDIEKYMDGGGNLTTAVNMWNNVINTANPASGSKPIIEDAMTGTTYTYSYPYSSEYYDGKTTKDDFRRLQEYTGFGLSLARLKQVATYLNTKYHTDVFKIENNIVSY
jgi:hypothetical protein